MYAKYGNLVDADAPKPAQNTLNHA